MFTDLSLQVALGSVPSSHLRVRKLGQLQSLPFSLYRSPIAGTKFTDLSLQITPYKEDGKKKRGLKKCKIKSYGPTQHVLKGVKP